MSLNNNAAIFLEVQSTPFPMTEATVDPLDASQYLSGFSPWSGDTTQGNAAVIAPYGVKNGAVITPAASGANDAVDISAGLISAAGATGADPDTGEVTVTSATLTPSRASTDTHLVSAIIVDNTGAYALVAGTEGTSFSDTFGAAGGPPLIAVDAVLVGIVRFSSQTPAPVASGEIQQVVGVSQETFDFPLVTPDELNGCVKLAQVPAPVHTGDVGKKVYVRGAVPVFEEIVRGSEYQPAETTHSINTTQTYDGGVSSVTSSIGQGTFTAILRDGITDRIVGLRNRRLWVKFKQDRNQAPGQLTLGLIGISRQFEVGGHPAVDVTISPESETNDLASI